MQLLAAPQRRTALQLGVDACLSPLRLRRGNLDGTFFGSCEAGFFSLYIDEELNVMPCSFCNDPAHAFSLREYSLEEIWTEKFGPYRARAAGNRSEQRECAVKRRGTCPFYPSPSCAIVSPDRKIFYNPLVFQELTGQANLKPIRRRSVAMHIRFRRAHYQQHTF